jgi:lactate dehydrogenase-like 2-hydroxyacid dehydrogenase
VIAGRDLKAIPILVPGYMNPHALRRIADTFAMRRKQSSALSELSDADREAVRGIAAMTWIGAGLMDALPNLEIVANYGVGYDKIDAAHAAQRGIMVTNTPEVLTEEVADTAVGLLLNTVREFGRAENWLRAGNWSRGEPYRMTPLTLRDRTIGIFGMGRIGLAIARRLEAFALPIAYHNRRPLPDVTYRYHPTLLELAEAVDTLISIVPGGAETDKAIDSRILSALGPRGVLVNVGRGSTVDQAALIAALANGTIAAAGLDVFENEPNVPEALLRLPNATLLPHVGSGSEYTRTAMADLCVDNLVAWFGEDRALTPVRETAKLNRRKT